MAKKNDYGFHFYIFFLHLHCEMNFAAVAQSVEHQLPKLRVTGSNPACRS